MEQSDVGLATVCAEIRVRAGQESGREVMSLSRLQALPLSGLEALPLSGLEALPLAELESVPDVSP